MATPELDSDDFNFQFGDPHSNTSRGAAKLLPAARPSPHTVSLSMQMEGI